MDNWQTPVALLVVALALAAVVRGALAKRKHPGCGTCACPSERIKSKLSHP